jgi:hypothetical protein
MVRAGFQTVALSDPFWPIWGQTGPMTDESPFADRVGTYSGYTCPNCWHRILLLSETLQRLQTSQGDSTIGYGQLIALCSHCSHVGIAPVDPTPLTVSGKVLEYLRSEKVFCRQMRCDVESCKAHQRVVLVGKIGTTDTAVNAAFASATISVGFCCLEGHQIQGLDGVA